MLSIPLSQPPKRQLPVTLGEMYKNKKNAIDNIKKCIIIKKEVLMFLSKKIYLQTSFSKQKIIEIVSLMVSPLSNSFNGIVYINNRKLDFEINKKYGKTFSSTLNQDVYVANSFNPIIKGKIYQYKNDCIIKLNAKMHPIINIFLTIWFGGIIIGIILTIFSIIQNNNYNIFTFFPLLLFIVARAIVYSSFKLGYDQIKNDLIESLNAEIIKKIKVYTSPNKR